MPTVEEAKNFNFTGAQVALICGEVTKKFNLSYTNTKVARLSVIVTSRVPSKKSTTGFRSYNNRVSFWGKKAEELHQTLTEGKFIAVLSYIFGGEQVNNGNWTHTFSAAFHKVYDDPDELGEIIKCNQDPNYLPLGLIINKE